MARPNQEAIDTFISITGASEAVAVQKLQERGGDLNAAVNAYFSEADPDMVHEPAMAVSPDDAMDLDNLTPAASSEHPFPFPFPFPSLSQNRTMSPTLFEDPNLVSQSFFDRDPFRLRAPVVSHPRQVREIPIEVKDSSESSGRAGTSPIIQDVTETAHAQGPDIHGTVTTGDDEDEDIPRAPQSSHVGINVSVPETFQDFDNDVEEEMIRAAIEASKKDAKKTGDFSSAHRQSYVEDDGMVQAVTKSLKPAEKEKPMHGKLGKKQASESGGSKPSHSALKKKHGRNGRSGAQSSSFHNDDDDGDGKEKPLVGQKSRQFSSASVDAPKNYQSMSSGSENLNISPPSSSSDFTSEWAGISSAECDEAMMLEAAMFGGVYESGHHFPYVRRDYNTPRPPSPSLEAQRLIREQQDDEYLAALQADREKEMKAIREAEARHLEEEAAKRLALEEEQIKQEEAQRKVEEEKERERQLAAKEASLPREPSPDEENAFTLMVRMPDGSRRGRRFHQSDKLQSLFDFIDIGRAVKPGSYRLVRPYPRRAFSDEESTSTLNELGLTSKHEALFLELI